MRCFARWERDDESELFFRDQTILQFGDSWELRASFVLLNPGSALPLNGTDQTQFLESKALPFFVKPNPGETYLEFSIDPLMRNIINLFASEYSGGTIKLYNLFNLRNQNANAAADQLSANHAHPKMFAKDHEVKFCHAPVVIASGKSVNHNPMLKQELIRYISLADKRNLYCVNNTGTKNFSITKAIPDDIGFVDSYHPSYSFTRGNTTHLGELGHNYAS